MIKTLCHLFLFSAVQSEKPGELNQKQRKAIELVTVQQERHLDASHCKKNLQCDQDHEALKRGTLFGHPVWFPPHHVMWCNVM